VGLVDQGRLPSTQPFASSFGWFDSHDKGDYSLKIKGGTRYFKYSKLNYEIPENRKRTLGTSSKPDILQINNHLPNQATVYPVVQAMGDGFATRAFSKGNGTVRLAFEERKTDERIESNSTFRFPSEVSPLTGAVGARLMQQ
jgi:hypothetical protein